MVRMFLGFLVLTVSAVGWPTFNTFAQTEKPLGQTDRSLFHFRSKATNQCVRVEPPPSGAIIAGKLVTRGCPRGPETLVEILPGSPTFLRFDLGAGEVRCINVRPIDMRTFPSDIFVNKCETPTSRWFVGGADAEGFGDFNLFTDSGPSLCLDVDELRITVTINVCQENKKSQKWKREPVMVN